MWVQVFTFFILCGVAVITVSVQLPVRIMKRKGKFDHFMFAFSAFYAPVGIHIAFLSIVLQPISSNLFMIALALIVFYAIVLSIFAIIAVYQMKLGQAIISILVAVIITILWGAYYVQSLGDFF
jgi:hypothetical protein